MARPETLQRLLEPVIEALGYELVCVELIQGGGTLLRLYIDSPQGINLEDCERVSHQVSGVMDVEDPISGEYTLEVSSPGLDRPLTKPEHFVQFAGYEVRIQLHSPLEVDGLGIEDGQNIGRRKFSGTLLGLEDNQVLLTNDDGEYRLPLLEIEKARLQPELPDKSSKGRKPGKKRQPDKLTNLKQV